jgi:hypothetical protein
MSLNNLPSVRSQSIARKPIGRKPVGGAARPLSQTPAIAQAASLTGASAEAVGNAAYQKSPTAAVEKAADPAVLTQQYARNVGGDVRDRGQTSPATSFPPAISGPGASVMYGSLASMAGPQPTVYELQAQSKTQSPVAGHLSHVKSFDSTASSSSIVSRWSTNASTVASYQTNQTTPLSSPSGYQVSPQGLPSLTRSMSESSSVSNASSMPTCNHCKTTIPATVSTFECLVCSTGSVSTKFCVYCFTTGAAASGHSQHDQSYYVTDSDPAMQPNQKIKTPGQSPIPPQIWAIRKNAAGRVWYQHRSTGFKTHVRPLTAVVPLADLPAGWETISNSDGKKYYRNSTTGVSSWTRPSVLPTGWREIRTPDSRPFYVCESLQLASWERPGEAPKAKTEKQKIEVPEGSSSIGKAGKSTATSSAVHGVAAAGAAVSVAASIIQLTDATDLTPQGILSATRAGARLTMHGAKFASKKMNLGKLVKSSKLRRASRVINTASLLAGNGGDDDFGGDIDSDPGDVNGDPDCENETVVGDGEVYVQAECVQEEYVQEEYVQEDLSYPPQQDLSYQPSYDPSPSVDPPEGQPTAFQTTYAEQSNVPLSAPQDDPPYQPSEQAPVIVNNVYVIEQTNFEETNVEINETNVQVDETDVEVSETNIEVNQTVESTLQVNETTQSIVFDESVQNNIEVIAPAIEPATPTEYLVPYGSGLPPIGVPDPFTSSGVDSTAMPPPINDALTEFPASELPLQDYSVPPLVFNPVLPGPMMVNPPTEQGGVIFAPTYV